MGTDHAQGLPLWGVTDDLAARQNPAPEPVFAAHAKLGGESRGVAYQVRLNGGLCLRQVLGVHELLPRTQFIRKLLVGVPQHLFPAW